MTKRFSPVFVLALLTGCGGAAEVPDWQSNAAQAMQAYQRYYLIGDTASAERSFQEVEMNIRRTGREDLLAHAYLARCATRAAALELDDCPDFEKFRSSAAKEDLAYAGYLAGKGSHKESEEPLSRLVGAAVRLRAGTITPAAIGQAIEAASAQGWRRPLLAWLGVQAKRAEDAGDSETAARVRRRMDLISG